jgi:hypothetical protein
MSRTMRTDPAIASFFRRDIGLRVVNFVFAAPQDLFVGCFASVVSHGISECSLV